MGRKDKVVSLEDSEAHSLGARMRLARQQKGISLTEMSKRLDYTKSHLSAVENGIGRPSKELLGRYELELGLEPGELTRARNRAGTEQRNLSDLEASGG